MKERESLIEFTYRDNQMVKKDVFVEFDFAESLRSDDRAFSPKQKASFIGVGQNKHKRLNSIPVEMGEPVVEEYIPEVIPEIESDAQLQYESQQMI